MPSWTHQLGNVKIEREEGGSADFGRKWNDGFKPHLRTRLEEAVALAPVMVRCAMDAVKRYIPAATGGGGASSPDLVAIEDGLRKYFELHEIIDKHGESSRWLGGIIDVYDLIDKGLGGGYDIVLYGKDDGAKAKTATDGKVNPGATSASLVRRAFKFTDEFGHAEWTGFKGPIYINMDWMAQPLISGAWGNGEALARVLVHEGSHRWAYTRDVLYKHNSAGFAAKELEDKAIGGKNLIQGSITADDKRTGKPYTEQQIKFKVGQVRKAQLEEIEKKDKIALQNAVDTRDRNKVRPVSKESKPLVSMNIKGMYGATPIDPIRWLENADSYSWFARRMWKLAGKPMK